MILLVATLLIATGGYAECKDSLKVENVMSIDNPDRVTITESNNRMKVEIDGKKGYVIIYRCKACGAIRKNKAANLEQEQQQSTLPFSEEPAYFHLSLHQWHSSSIEQVQYPFRL